MSILDRSTWEFDLRSGSQVLGERASAMVVDETDKWEFNPHTGFADLRSTSAIPVPPRRVVTVRSNDTTNKRNVAQLAAVGGFGALWCGVKS